MFEFVYTNPVAKGEEVKAQELRRRLFDYYQRNRTSSTGVSGHPDGGGRGAGRLRLYCGHDRRLRGGVVQRGVHSPNPGA